MWTLGWEIRHALRAIWREWTVCVVIILVLGLGIGANTTVFSVVHAVLLRSLPFDAPDRLVWVSNQYPGGDPSALSNVTSRVDVFEAWRARATSFDGMTAYNAFFGYGSYTLTGRGEPERLIAVRVAHDFFDVLGVRPAMGRTFTQAETALNGPPAVLLSSRSWQRRFAGDPAVVGRALTLDGASVTVVGVLPATFDFSSLFAPGTDVDLVLPLRYDVARRQGNTLAVIGRLRPGRTLSQARADLEAVTGQLKQERPEGIFYGSAVVSLKDRISGRSGRALLTLWAAVAGVLLIVCANVSSLTLSRSAARRKEVALQAALGAGRGRLLGQLVVESVVLSSAGALVGLGLAWVATRSVASLDGVSLPRLAAVGLDGMSVAVTALVAVSACVLFTLAPALQLWRASPQGVLKEGSGTGGRRSSGLRAALVVAETAIACMLLVGAGLLMHSFIEVLGVELGFEPDRAVTLRVDPARSLDTAAARAAFYAEVVRRVEALPGVESAGVTDALPLDRQRSWGVRAKGVIYPEGTSRSAYVRMIGPGYLASMGIPVLAGRGIGPEDADVEAPVVVINDSMARRLWPGREAVGQTALVGGDEHRVVGVVADVKHSNLEEPSGMEIYLSVWRADGRSADLVMRTRRRVEALAPDVRRTLRALDPTMPVSDIRSLEQFVERAVSPRRFFVWLLGALLLAALGIYGVVSHAVTQQTREIGIRMALGASASGVHLDVLRRVLTLAGTGLALGLAGSVVVGRGMQAMLYGVSGLDPLTFAGMATALLLTAGAAGYVPARRASMVDPMVALREE